MPLARRQPIGRPLHAGRDRRGRRVAVLECRDFVGRHAFEAAAARPASLHVIGVEQHAGIGAAGATQDFAQHRDAIEHGVLRIELDREPEAALAADVGATFHVLDGIADRPDVLPRRAHDQRAIERHRVVAGDLEVVEQPLALVAGCENPAVFAAQRADRDFGGTHHVEYGVVRHSPFIAALEVGAAQFDRIEAAVARGLDRDIERRGVEGPSVQRKPAEWIHGNRPSSSRCWPAA